MTIYNGNSEHEIMHAPLTTSSRTKTVERTFFKVLNSESSNMVPQWIQTAQYREESEACEQHHTKSTSSILILNALSSVTLQETNSAVEGNMEIEEWLQPFHNITPIFHRQSNVSSIF